MPTVRHSHSVNFKIRAVFEAGSSQCTMKEVAARLGVHPTQLSHWKKQATDVLETHWPIPRKPAGKATAPRKSSRKWKGWLVRWLSNLSTIKKNWVARDRGAQSHGGE
ncbi:MAG: transposase [Deltaproteobacteria bacterium]|nr:transposase [Deltaproteobacteria bacterium]